jgi:hypothetical protein
MNANGVASCLHIFETAAEALNPNFSMTAKHLGSYIPQCGYLPHPGHRFVTNGVNYLLVIFLKMSLFTNARNSQALCLSDIVSKIA